MVSVAFIQVVILLTEYSSIDQIEKNGVGGVCSTYGEERCIEGFGGET